MKVAIELEVPDGAVDDATEAKLVRSIKEQLALKLYLHERITVTEGARLLGQTRVQFLDLLRTSGIGFRVDLDEEDFAQLRQIREKYALKTP